MSAVFANPPTAREQQLETERREILSHYAFEQRDALMQLYSLVKRHPGTGGGIAAAKFLLGLYNGPRFPFDLTELRRFDPGNLAAAMTVLRMDATRQWCEVHVLLNAILGTGANAGAEFEHWAYELHLPKRCKRDQLPALSGMPVPSTVG